MFHEVWYTDTQAQNLANLAKQVTNLNGSIIEIGCWEGKSASYLANSVYPEILICNDTWQGNVEETKVTGELHISEKIAKERDVYSVFLENMNTLTKKNYTVVKEDCLVWLKSYSDPVKFCHIDASHEYASVYKTIALILPNVVEGGVLCGDDFLSAGKHRRDLQGGVERAVEELLPNFKSIGNLWYWVKPKF